MLTDFGTRDSFVGVMKGVILSRCPEARLVQNWYFRYLQRPADAVGMDGWVGQLRQGTPAECVEAQILASDEYYGLPGRTAAGTSSS